MKLVSTCLMGMFPMLFFFTHLQNKLFYTGFTEVPKRFKESKTKIYFKVSSLTCCQRNLLTWVLIHGSSPHAAIHRSWYYQPVLWHLQPSSDDFVPVCSEKPFFEKKERKALVYLEQLHLALLLMWRNSSVGVAEVGLLGCCTWGIFGQIRLFFFPPLND